MRRTKLYQLMVVAGGLGVAVATTPVWAKPTTTVVPLNWTAGTATVDGNISEWDLSTDAATKMCEAGRVDSSGNCDGKEQLSTLYARYDCDTDTMYVLVLKEDGHTASGDRWVKIYDVSNSEYPITIEDVVVDGESQGYEASFSLAAGTYNDVQVHINIDGGRTSSTGKNGTTRSITVPVSCEMPPEEEPTLACSDLVGSNDVPMKSIAEYEADGDGYSFVAGSGTDIITIDGDGNPSVNGGTIDIATFIEDGVQDSDGVVSGDSVEFCQVPVFDSKDAEVCLWMADQDKDGNYINIEEVGCVEAKKHKFYAIEAGGEFSSVLEAE